MPALECRIGSWETIRRAYPMESEAWFVQEMDGRQSLGVTVCCNLQMSVRNQIPAAPMNCGRLQT